MLGEHLQPLLCPRSIYLKSCIGKCLAPACTPAQGATGMKLLTQCTVLRGLDLAALCSTAGSKGLLPIAPWDLSPSEG